MLPALSGILTDSSALRVAQEYSPPARTPRVGSRQNARAPQNSAISRLARLRFIGRLQLQFFHVQNACSSACRLRVCTSI